MYTKIYDFLTSNRPHNFPRRYERVDLDYVRCWLKDKLNHIQVHGWKKGDGISIRDGKWPCHYPYQVHEMSISLLHRYIDKSDLSSWLDYVPGRTQADVEEIFKKAIRATYWEPIKRPFRWLQWYINPHTIKPHGNRHGNYEN